MFQLVTPWCAYQVRVACGRRIGMCGYIRQSLKTDVLVEAVVTGSLTWSYMIVIISLTRRVESGSSFDSRIVFCY